MAPTSEEQVINCEVFVEELEDLLNDIKETKETGLMVRDAVEDLETLQLYQARFSCIDSTYHRFMAVYDKAKPLCKLLKLDVKKVDDLKTAARQAYYEVLAIGRLSSPNIKEQSEEQRSATPSTSFRLPRINLPIFNGDLNNWPSFKDTYVSLVHDNDLDNIQKFHYLKSSLKGSALQSIATIPLTAENYHQAWSLLIKKYDNKRILATNYLIQIFNFKPITRHNLTSLEHFSSVVLESADAFRNLNLDDAAGFILYTYALRLLDSRTRENFEAEFGTPDTLPSYNEFTNFIHEQYLQLQTSALTSSLTSPSVVPDTRANVASPKHVFMAQGVNLEGRPCPVCDEKHRIFECSGFLGWTPEERFGKMKEQNRCINCLARGHSSGKCPSNTSCRKCQKRHNTLLHFETRSTSPETLNNSSQGHPSFRRSQTPRQPLEAQEVRVEAGTPKTHAGALLAATVSNDSHILLGTAIARIKDNSGKLHHIRILIDSGSQRSFITSECARKLRLPFNHFSHRLVGLSDQSISGGNCSTACTLVPSRQEIPRLKTTAVILDRISGPLPSCRLSNISSHLSSEYDLADPTFGIPGPIEFLLGADLFASILTGPVLNMPQGMPTALQTIFGLVLIGKTSEVSGDTTSTFLTLQEQPAETYGLADLILKFWEVEEVMTVDRTDPLDLKCEEHFKQTHTRDEQGRYIVSLPFKTEPVVLGDSKTGALQRFRKLEHRFAKNPNYKADYDRVMDEYLQKDYMMPAVQPGRFFLPHHGVSKDSVSTKLRVVLDASFQTDKGSLNDQLLTGPKLQHDIRDVLLRFRVPRVAMTSDISQMYLQILIAPQHRVFQHLLYRFRPSDAVITFELQRLAFGMSCSPFLALRVLQQLVKDEGAIYPLATKALKSDIYVDDILTGADTVEEAQCLRKELIALLDKGGFQLKKWHSNSEKLLGDEEENPQNNSVPLSNMEDSTVKILGMQWEPTADVLSYHIQKIECIVSKRGILSTIARMYDPLGYMAPVIFKAKCMLQKLWELQLNWDEPIPETLRKEWLAFYEGLVHLQTIMIPRCLFSQKPKRVIIVGFADASSLGYAAAIYLRAETADGSVFNTLIFAKTRLAPLKPLSIPRLELSAALLLANAVNSLQEFFASINNSAIYCLSDSSTVLGWLKSPLHHLKIFVANRASKILDITGLENWYHVRSEDNAADLASRGIDPEALPSRDSWWKGPEWLQQPTAEWPLRKLNDCPVPSELPETKALLGIMTQTTSDFLEEFLKKFSIYLRMVRVVAYILRFIHNSKSSNAIPGEKLTGNITIQELNQSEETLIKIVQNQHFPDELAGNFRKSKLTSLRPFVDSRGILRVGGRLENAPLSFEAKHPILLPHKSHFVDILIDHFHLMYLHAGPQLLNSLIRRRYWIISSRRIVRSRVHQCAKCHRLRVAAFQPVMADLPLSRFEQGRAFINVGVDFAGPFCIRESMRRKAAVGKAYFSLFVCFSTKAVHIELVSNLTTEAFLACLDRFIARRGLPSKIFSDNATNFVGAQRRLRELYAWWSNMDTHTQVENYLSKRQIHWNFIPPTAPHFGGLWEAGVKSLKYHLTRILNYNQPLTFEELSTVGARVEAIMNSRPLHPASASPDDFATLTPGHFLIGEALLSTPQHDWTERASHLLNRWQFLQKCVTSLWNRWKMDYLTCLQQRTKWRKESPNITIGTLVLMMDPTTFPLEWPTARVIEIFPGPDRVVRVVKLKTIKGEFVRPVARLAPLLPPQPSEIFT